MASLRKLWNKARPWVYALFPAACVGALIGAYPGYKTYEYTWKNAQFCTACHVHDYATVGWKRSAHGAMTTCHDCHHQPLHEYIRELYVLVKDHPKYPKDLHHTPYVPKDLCQACHVSHPEDQSTISGPLSLLAVAALPKVDHMKLHRFHLEQKVRMPLPSSLEIEKTAEFGSFNSSRRGTAKERLITCMDCHGGPPNRAHNFTATDRSCVQCHVKMHENKMARQVGCRSCHFQEFMTPIPPTEKGPDLQSAVRK